MYARWATLGSARFGSGGRQPVRGDPRVVGSGLPRVGAMTEEREPDSDEPGALDVEALEQEVESARHEWEMRVDELTHTLSRPAPPWRPLRARKARRARDELDRAQSEYQLAHKRLRSASPPPPVPSEEAPSSEKAAPSGESGSAPSLSVATLEQLRELGLSLTQARRLIRHREEHGSFDDLNELDSIPGFPDNLLARMKDRCVP